MKLAFKKSFIAMVGLIVIIASGCLKDKAYDNGEIQSGQGSEVKVLAIGTNVVSQLNFLTTDNSYISASSGKLSNTLPVRLLYPQSEYTSNSVNVPKQVGGAGGDLFTKKNILATMNKFS